MTQNLGTKDRILRAVAVLPLSFCAVLAPLPGWIRIVALGAPAVYLLFTALAGSCLGYTLMGRSSCSIPKR